MGKTLLRTTKMSKLDEWNEDELCEVARGLRWIYEHGISLLSLKYRLAVKRFMSDFASEARKQDEEEKDSPEEV